jgi:hypothetical protein
MSGLRSNMQFFTLPCAAHRLEPVIKSVFLFLALLLCNLAAKSQKADTPQSESSSFMPADSEFIMQVSRINNEVVISLTFNDSLVFDYVSIERRAEFNGEFSQCKYISYDEVKTKGRHLVKKDTYAYAAANDVLYRIKLVTKEGAQRIFPAIDLPSVKK